MKNEITMAWKRNLYQDRPRIIVNTLQYNYARIVTNKKKF